MIGLFCFRLNVDIKHIQNKVNFSQKKFRISFKYTDSF